MGIICLPSEEIGSREDITFGEDIPWGEGGPREMMRVRAKLFFRRRWPKENMCPQGWILGREKWDQIIDWAWVENILKEKMGHGKNVSLRMNSDEDE